MVVESGGQHGQGGPTASRPTYKLIQILRALAALMVVAHHATIMLWQREHLPVRTWFNGASGVDLFFVISGFVMTVSSAPLSGASHPARTFLARRLERVVPMYWLVTTAKVAVLLLVPALGLNALGTWGHVLASYLFIPSVNAQGALEPVVIVGWTLNFEMAFYVLFALALGLRFKPLFVAGPVLVAAFLWPLTVTPLGPGVFRFFEATLPLEFLLGVGLAMALPHVRRAPWPVGLLLVVAGLWPLLLWDAPNFSWWRGLQWGPAALAVVAGALILEARWGARSPRWMLELGDASYSIYLIHTFTLPVAGILLVRFGHLWAGEIAVALGFTMLLSAAAGEATYRLVERPITAWFKGRRKTAVPAVR